MARLQLRVKDKNREPLPFFHERRSSNSHSSGAALISVLRARKWPPFNNRFEENSTRNRIDGFSSGHNIRMDILLLEIQIGNMKSNVDTKTEDKLVC
jgi:hypothetical protein